MLPRALLCVCVPGVSVRLRGVDLVRLVWLQLSSGGCQTLPESRVPAGTPPAVAQSALRSRPGHHVVQSDRRVLPVGGVCVAVVMVILISLISNMFIGIWVSCVVKKLFNFVAYV